MSETLQTKIAEVTAYNYRRDTVQYLLLVLRQNFETLSEHRRNELTQKVFDLGLADFQGVL